MVNPDEINNPNESIKKTGEGFKHFTSKAKEGLFGNITGDFNEMVRKIYLKIKNKKIKWSKGIRERFQNGKKKNIKPITEYTGEPKYKVESGKPGNKRKKRINLGESDSNM